MGEAKRKRDEAERKKSAEMGKGLLSLLLTLLCICIIALPVYLVWYVLEKPKAESRFTDSKSLNKAASKPGQSLAPARPQPRVTPRMVKINTTEGFITKARSLSATKNVFDLEESLGYWRAAVDKSHGNIEAKRGYATTLVQLLLHKDRTQPSRPLPAGMLQEARSACASLLMYEAGKLLTHELAAYCEALCGNLSDAQTQMAQADLVRGGPAITPDGRDMMMEITLISQRRNNPLRPYRPLIPGMPLVPNQR